MPHALLILFAFAFGACVGSFLNVVVWRLPRVEHPEADRSLLGPIWRTLGALSHPPSHCPNCNHPIRWYDNLPVIGWLKLGGRCRDCRAPISARYPVVEAVVGGLFVLTYAMFFLLGHAPCSPDGLGLMVDRGYYAAMPLDPRTDWPVYGLAVFTVACLLAASLIDAELFIIPIEIPWLMAAVGVAYHAATASPTTPGALLYGPTVSAMGLGAVVGLAVSIALQQRGLLKRSFPDGEPMLEIDRKLLAEDVARDLAEARKRGEDMATYKPSLPPVPPEYTRVGVAMEVRKEMAFLLPPMLLAVGFGTLATTGPLAGWWADVAARDWVGGACGALFGACVGAVVVWVFRIFGSLAFGRVAMGLGDVHLMFGVGAVVGAGPATVAFFLAPFFALAVSVWRLLTRGSRELPFGPYLALATCFLLFFYCPLAVKLAPGLQGLAIVVRNAVAGGG